RGVATVLLGSFAGSGNRFEEEIFGCASDLGLPLRRSGRGVRRAAGTTERFAIATDRSGTHWSAVDGLYQGGPQRTTEPLGRIEAVGDGRAVGIIEHDSSVRPAPGRMQ